MNKQEYIKKAEEIIDNMMLMTDDWKSDLADICEQLYQLHLEGVREIESEIFGNLLRSANEIDEANSLREFNTNKYLRPVYSAVLREVWALAHSQSRTEGKA